MAGRPKTRSDLRQRQLRDVRRRRRWRVRQLRNAVHAPALCVYCGCVLTYEIATTDHIKPVSDGGRLGVKNYALSCRTCNMSKGTQPLLQFLLSRLHEEH